MSGPLILALDLASVTGVCEGRAGGRPRAWTWRLGSTGSTQAHRLAELLKLTSAHLAVSRPDQIWIEAPMAPAVMVDIGGSAQTAAFLFGCPAVVKAVAYLRGVYRVTEANVQDVRHHFIQQRRLPKGEGKRAVVQRCRQMGWEVENDNEADAAALWSYAGAQHNPRLAAAVTPLFGGGGFTTIGRAAQGVVAGLAEKLAEDGAA